MARSRAVTSEVNISERAPRVAFVYGNPRTELAARVRAGEAPDTGLLGQNHLAELGITATVHDPILRRQARTRSPLRHWLTWYGRELTLPWEIRSADVACTSLVTLFPLAARVRSRPRVVALNMGLCNTYARSSRHRRHLYRAALGSTAAVVCFATSQRKRLLDQTGLPADRVQAILLGVDAAFYMPAPLRADGHVLAVGRDLARDYRTFAAAVDGLDRKTIVVASDRNLRGIDLPPEVDVRIDTSYKDLRRLYADAACVVIPTRHEDYPYGADCSGQTVLLDAMAAARPVVLSARSTLSDYIEDGKTALTVPPEDPAALRNQIERILRDATLAASLGGAAREQVERRLTTRHLASRLAPVLQAASGTL